MVNTTIPKSWDRHMSISIYVGGSIGIAIHCLKSDHMRSYSGLSFPTFEPELRIRISPYSVRMQENADQNNSKYWHFLRSD